MLNQFSRTQLIFGKEAKWKKAVWRKIKKRMRTREQRRTMRKSNKNALKWIFGVIAVLLVALASGGWWIFGTFITAANSIEKQEGRNGKRSLFLLFSSFGLYFRFCTRFWLDLCFGFFVQYWIHNVISFCFRRRFQISANFSRSHNNTTPLNNVSNSLMRKRILYLGNVITYSGQKVKFFLFFCNYVNFFENYVNSKSYLLPMIAAMPKR